MREGQLIPLDPLLARRGTWIAANERNSPMALLVFGMFIPYQSIAAGGDKKLEVFSWWT